MDLATWAAIEGYLDRLTRDLAAFRTIRLLLEAPGGYYPTARPDLDTRWSVLADLYDACQEARGDPRRAHRPGQPGRARCPVCSMDDAEPGCVCPRATRIVGGEHGPSCA
jgi:hypothetical protein